MNPVQISARGMDPERLRRKFGDQISFWGGGVDTQHVLPFAKTEEVAEHVKKLIKIFTQRGGYIRISTQHTIGLCIYVKIW